MEYIPKGSPGYGGPYGTDFLNEVKRVRGIANVYNIKVMITIHTVLGSAGRYLYTRLCN